MTYGRIYLHLTGSLIVCLRECLILQFSARARKISDPMKRGLLYIGETRNLRRRLSHHRRTFKKLFANVSFSKLPDSVRSYQRKELENDLIGGYYFQTKSVPLGQFARALLKEPKKEGRLGDISLSVWFKSRPVAAEQIPTRAETKNFDSRT